MNTEQQKTAAADALTWQDVERIVRISYDLDPLYSSEHRLAEFQNEEGFYREVLKRFNQEREGRK